MATNIKTIVRVRPQLSREDSECLVRMPSDEPGKTYLDHPKGTKKYIFDECIWSHNQDDANYESNLSFYQRCGYNLLQHLYQGYNVCLLAYGQTGSGKTYTMMGQKDDYGIIPLMVRDILRQRDALVSDKINCDIKFSYIEIYNEKVKDLLGGSKVCRVREDPDSGTYIEGLTESAIDSFEAFFKLLSAGNSLRTTASTKMNETSSRSHAVLTFILRQTRFANNPDMSQSVGAPAEEMVSNIKLVDLAGSERLAKTQVFHQADRLKEGTQINKSLTALGRCINLLSLGTNSVIPYRDSTLTFLMRENLAGNSKTSMIFCISPTDGDETLQTLNYATQVKKIKTKAKASDAKILAPPVDWAALREKDVSVVKRLEEEINDLKIQLSKSKESKENEKVHDVIDLLTTEGRRQSFEIKYLQNQFRSKDEELEELKTQNKLLELESNAVLGKLFVKEQKRLMARASDTAKRCEAEAQSLKNIIQDCLTYQQNSRYKASDLQLQ